MLKLQDLKLSDTVISKSVELPLNWQVVLQELSQGSVSLKVSPNPRTQEHLQVLDETPVGEPVIYTGEA